MVVLAKNLYYHINFDNLRAFPLCNVANGNALARRQKTVWQGKYPHLKFRVSLHFVKNKRICGSFFLINFWVFVIVDCLQEESSHVKIHVYGKPIALMKPVIHHKVISGNTKAWCHSFCGMFRKRSSIFGNRVNQGILYRTNRLQEVFWRFLEV